MANGFSYCAEHILSSTPSLTDYQVKILVNYGTGTNSGENVYCNQHCRGDFNDIRFEDSLGADLPHWRETYTDYEYAVFWVRVPTISASTTLVVKYGNVEAPSASDPISTFLFYDAFDGTVINGTTWSGGINTITYSISDLFRFIGASDYWIDDSSDTGSQIWSRWTPTTNCKVVWKSTMHMATAEEIGQAGFAFVDASNKVRVSNLHTDGDSDEVVTGCYGNIDTVIYDFNDGENDESRVFAIAKVGSKFTLKHRVYGADRWVNDVTHTISTAVTKLALVAGKQSGIPFCNYVDIDWVYVRNYAEIEPTNGAWSEEELLFATFESIYSIKPEPSIALENIKFYHSLSSYGGDIDPLHLQVSSVIGNEIARITSNERQTGTVKYTKQYIRNENDMTWGPVCIYLSSRTQSSNTQISFSMAGSKSMLTTSATLSGVAIVTATGFLTTTADLRGEVAAGECVYNNEDGVAKAIAVREVASTYIQLDAAYIGTLGSGKLLSVAPATMSRYIAPITSTDPLTPLATIGSMEYIGMWKRYEVYPLCPPFSNDWFVVKYEEEEL